MCYSEQTSFYTAGSYCDPFGQKMLSRQLNNVTWLITSSKSLAFTSQSTDSRLFLLWLVTGPVHAHQGKLLHVFSLIRIALSNFLSSGVFQDNGRYLGKHLAAEALQHNVCWTPTGWYGWRGNKNNYTDSFRTFKFYNMDVKTWLKNLDVLICSFKTQWNEMKFKSQNLLQGSELSYVYIYS